MTASVDTAAMLSLATEAVHQAGHIISNGDPGTVTDKGDRDLSTEMDLASEHAVRERLQKRTPNIPVLGEEEGGPDPSTGICWVLDPIDGTVNYLHHLPTFAIALSLIEAGQTIAAVTHMPATQTTYTATAGGGAYVDGKRMAASTTGRLRDALIAVDQFTFVDDDPDQVNAMRLRLIEQLTPVVHRIRINGSSSVDLAWTAEGKLDACIMLANNPWDTSAGALFAREAGAVVTDLNGEPHQIESAMTVAAAPNLADDLIGALQRLNA